MHDGHGLPGADVVVDGVRLHVVRHGRERQPGDPVVLFVHDLDDTGRVWCDVARDLEHDHRSLLPDLAGCGRSEHPGPARSTPAAQAGLLIGLLDACHHERAVVVGHGYGGIVAANLVDLAPDRVSAIVLIGSTLHADAWPPPDVATMRRPFVGTAYAALQHRSWSTGRGIADVAAGADAGVVEAARRTLTAAACPRLVVWGADDADLPAAYGRRLADDIAAPWVPVARAGHDVPVERPERVAEEIAGFLADLPAAVG